MSISDRRATGPRDVSGSDVASRLSKREREIVTLISQGLSNQEIAEKLFLSINSVKTYIRTAYRRLDVTTRSQAVIWGVRNERRLTELAQADAHSRAADSSARADRALWMVRQDGHPFG
jgi:DNA-binding CsgD family transcriptional regulator